MKVYCRYFLIGSLFILCQQSIAASNNVTLNQQEMLLQTHLPVYRYQIIQKFPHPQPAFTEGLVVDQGILFESTGLYGQSILRQINLADNQVVKKYQLPPQYFGEGITILGNELYQLTYQSQLGFIYDKNTLQLQGSFHYKGEGWGITTDGKSLIMSNGSPVLTYLDPKTFGIEKTVKVQAKRQDVNLLNELEYIHGKIYANIWQTNLIAIIAPDTGKVESWIDLTGLDPNLSSPEFVLNGIAYDEKQSLLIVTGKDWPYFYSIKLIPAKNH